VARRAAAGWQWAGSALVVAVLGCVMLGCVVQGGLIKRN
jgi:hypothetical protein